MEPIALFMVLLSLPSLIQGSNSLSARFELIFYNGTGLLDPIDYPGPFPYGHTACASYAISLHADDAVGFEHDAVDKVCKTGVVSGPMLEGEEAAGSVPLYVLSGKASSLFYYSWFCSRFYPPWLFSYQEEDIKARRIRNY